MKQNTEEPDYRSMNEVQLKYELIRLEKKILDITGDPIDYKHYSPFLDWCRDDAKVEAVEEMMLDRCFILNLLFDIHCTPAEVARLEKINGMLLEMTNRTYHLTADLMRALIVMKKDEMDDDYELEGKLVPLFDIPYSILRLEDDNYYGSDFIRMAAILQETEKHKSGMADVSCDWTRLKDKTPSATDAELECANIMDDEVLKMINEQYERAKQILKEHQEGHAKLAQLLIEREVIFADDVEEIFGKRPWTSRAEELLEAQQRADAERMAEERFKELEAEATANNTTE